MSLLCQSIDDDPKRLVILQEWAKKNNIWINDNVIIKWKENVGFGVFIRKDVDSLIDRQVLVIVPKKIILSARSSSLAKFIHPNLLFSHDASAGLILSTVLLHEFILGKKGKWWDYLQSMPRMQKKDGTVWGISIPMNWQNENRIEAWKWIEFSEAGRMVKRTMGDGKGLIEGIGMSFNRLQNFFNQTALPILCDAHPTLDLNNKEDKKNTLWNDFLSCQTLISSRAFVVDMYHGLALVPVSDMFNHSDDANVHFEADEEVCDECGELGKCIHNDDPLPSCAYGRPSAFLPAVTGPNSIDWKPPKELDGLDTVDMVAQETIKPGQEAFNTYGLMSNSILLTTYGFCLEEETEWERFGWDWRNTFERDEIKEALKLNNDIGSKKRQREEDDVIKGKYGRWVKACITLSGLPSTHFDELKLDPMLVIEKQKLKGHPGMASLTLPIKSPFSTLSKQVKVMEGNLDHDQDSARDTMFTFLSNSSFHDGSRDEQQPLFLDSEGRISFPLWRITLLSAIIQIRPSDDELDIGLINLVEKSLAEVIKRCENDESKEYPFTLQSKSIFEILQYTLQLLYNLIDSRKRKQFINHEDGQEIALKIIESSKDENCLRSAVLHAFQEHSAIQVSLEKIKTFLSFLQSLKVL